MSIGQNENGDLKGMEMRIYFARHGESEANILQEFSNRGRKHGLTEKGKKQAERLADNLKSVPFSALLCSPLLRATQTAEIVSGRLSIPYEAEEGLREYDVGIFEGKSDEASWRRFGENFERWMEGKNWDSGIEEGESYNDIRARFMPFFQRLEAEYQPTDANILLIGHGGTFLCMLPLVLSNVDHTSSMTSPMDNTAYIVAECRGGEWVCLRWGEKEFEV